MSYLLIFGTVSLLIILHELGHFLVAKRMRIPIARFSVGLGPKVWGFKMGGTEYWLSMIPCGGYVMPALKDEEAFYKIPLKSRILFALGGPAANILGAFLCLSLMNIVKLGFSVNSAIYLPLEQICQVAMQIGTAIPSLFSQPENLYGIVGIVAAGGPHVGLSFVKLLQFSVLLNVNFAVLNLLPILPLDGGKIMMGLLRKIYQPLRRLEMPLTVGGWVLLAGLMLYATALDLARVAHGILG
ncbi:MAG TPA: site-2 protease family protein [Verrucomicrobiae bacterium]|nr:site-2 protease family protein [Verrucomicrobiae bacterium]